MAFAIKIRPSRVRSDRQAALPAAQPMFIFVKSMLSDLKSRPTGVGSKSLRNFGCERGLNKKLKTQLFTPDDHD